MSLSPDDLSAISQILPADRVVTLDTALDNRHASADYRRIIADIAATDRHVRIVSSLRRSRRDQPVTRPSFIVSVSGSPRSDCYDGPAERGDILAFLRGFMTSAPEGRPAFVR